MPSFTRGGLPRTPFGKNVYLRSTKGCNFESYTCAMDSVPLQIIDNTPQRILQPGTVMAKITSGPDTGKVGPFQAAGTSEVQTLTPTTVTAGTFKLTVQNPQTLVTRTTAPIAWNANQATILAALVALDNVDPGDITVGGAATANAGATTYTFTGQFIGDVPQMTVDNSALTGTFAVTTTTPGVAGAADGRQLTANIVGINDTFLPWQLLEHDENIAVLYVGIVVQGWCFELNAAGQPIVPQTATVNAMFAQKGIDINFR